MDNASVESSTGESSTTERCPDCLGTKMDMDLYGCPCGTCGGQGKVTKGFLDRYRQRMKKT